MEHIKLKDIATLITKGTTPTSLGFDFEKEGINFVKIESITEDGNFIENKFAHISNECNEKLNRSKLQENDILFSIAGAIGRVAVVNKEILPANTNQALAIIRIPEGMYEYRFLEYVLKSNYVAKQFEKKKQGVAQLNLSLQDIGELLIPRVELEKQKYIVEVFEKLEKNISCRKLQLEKLDELVKARFVELFGDRYTNDKNWENKPLYECADFYNGKAHEQVVDENGEYILVTSRCIASDITDYRRTNALLFPLKTNDIAMVMSDVPNGRALAKCILIDENDKYTLNQRICCLRNYSFNPIFFYYLLNRHEYFLSFNDGNAQTNLRKDDLLACNIIMPPIELQNQFAAFVEQTDKSKLAVQKSLDKLELLKKALMQKYFE
ncbi:MAG: restriction endonuclease subunit S [Clostridia bacterium]|nr:restriction endonuclease subunit S [Clostridia bacterium]